MKTLIILFLVLGSAGVYAESGCGGPTYTNPTCNGACTLANCQDTSFNQDGSQYQCCPYIAAAPEFPQKWWAVFSAFIFVGLLFVGRRLTRRRSPRRK